VPLLNNSALTPTVVILFLWVTSYSAHLCHLYHLRGWFRLWISKAGTVTGAHV
jgi:hypothetical protein